MAALFTDEPVWLLQHRPELIGQKAIRAANYLCHQSEETRPFFGEFRSVGCDSTYTLDVNRSDVLDSPQSARPRANPLS